MLSIPDFHFLNARGGSSVLLGELVLFVGVLVEL